MDWRRLFQHATNGMNGLIVFYFLVASGTYTVLMFIAAVSVWVHRQRLAYQSGGDIRESVVTPPATIIVPAWNEQAVVVESIKSILKTDYPGLQVLLVDDGSTDGTLEHIVEAFQLDKMDLIYRPRMATHAVRGFYLNPRIPNLLVVSKEHGGKADALNVGISVCRTPYFCTLDADCILERDALLRLMRPIIQSPINTVASAGIVRILNGSEVVDGHVTRVGLPKRLVERFQVVEYLRTFLLSRVGWDALKGTLIVSGAFAVFHLESVISAGAFAQDTVTEDMDLIVQIHRWARSQKSRIKIAFTCDPICWTECPTTLANLGRQRRRWQMGLCQTLWKNSEMLFNGKYGRIGWVSLPFKFFVETLGTILEFLGYLLVSVALFFGVLKLPVFILFACFALLYGAFLSIGAVLLEDLTCRRYPSYRDLMILFAYAVLENLGYRQIILYFRLQGTWQFLTGFREWEKVIHVGTNDRVSSIALPD